MSFSILNHNKSFVSTNHRHQHQHNTISSHNSPGVIPKHVHASAPDGFQGGLPLLGGGQPHHTHPEDGVDELTYEKKQIKQI